MCCVDRLKPQPNLDIRRNDRLEDEAQESGHSAERPSSAAHNPLNGLAVSCSALLGADHGLALHLPLGPPRRVESIETSSALG
jgi:hypothetical protein